MQQFLNYHHLRYFHAIASEGNLTRAAEHLHISQSALSLQLKKLEESLGHALFLRQNKRLVLTEAGKIALDYAEMIFKSGEEMLGTLQREGSGPRRVLRVGAVSTLSRNFLLAFLQPALERSDCEVVVQSGGLQKQLDRLKAHTVDIVLSNFAVTRDAHTGWHSHLLDEQPVSLVGKPSPDKSQKKWKFPDSLGAAPLILPSLESNIRVAFDLVMDSLGIHPVIVAEADDMALLRLFARESKALTLVPPVVVQDELKSKELIEVHRFDEIHESFYAISPSRKFPDPLSRELLARWGERPQQKQKQKNK
jgi:LysR family transcriptional activator of nhaA